MAEDIIMAEGPQNTEQTIQESSMKKRTPAFTWMTKKNYRHIHTIDGPIRAFKVSRPGGKSPQHPSTAPVLTCSNGAYLFVGNSANTDWTVSCGGGVNVANFDWCGGEFGPGSGSRIYDHYLLWVVEFNTYDIACIPRGSDGKIRLKSCTVVRQIVSRRRPKGA